jgi:hypothetical protein
MEQKAGVYLAVVLLLEGVLPGAPQQLGNKHFHRFGCRGLVRAQPQQGKVRLPAGGGLNLLDGGLQSLNLAFAGTPVQAVCLHHHLKRGKASMVLQLIHIQQARSDLHSQTLQMMMRPTPSSGQYPVVHFVYDVPFLQYLAS